ETSRMAGGGSQIEQCDAREHWRSLKMPLEQPRVRHHVHRPEYSGSAMTSDLDETECWQMDVPQAQEMSRPQIRRAGTHRSIRVAAGTPAAGASCRRAVL